LDLLVDSDSGNLSPASAIASHLIFGSQIQRGSTFALPMYDKMSSTDGNIQSTTNHHIGRSLCRTSDAAVHGVAFKNAWDLLEEVQVILFSTSTSPAEQSVAYRELSSLITEIGSLLALSPDPTMTYSLVNIRNLLALVIYMFAACKAKSWDSTAETVVRSVLHFCGGLFSSRRGVFELALAFEDVRLEQAWLQCFLGDIMEEHSFIYEIRRGPGALSMAEAVQGSASDFDISPILHITKPGIGVATVTLLDAYRISQVILQLQLGDMEQVRRHSDTLRRACLDLCKLCTYESGREVRLRLSEQANE
jgi:hypothetical protein